MTQRIPSLSAILLMTATPALADVPTVVTDFGPTQGIVARVMQGIGEPAALLTATDTPHSFAMRPSHARMLADAEIVFWAGADLTPWLAEPIENVATNATPLELLEVGGWDVLEARSKHDHGHGGHNDHDDEHDHAEVAGDDAHDHDHEEDVHKDEHDHDHAEDAHEGEHDHADEDHAAAKDHDDHDDHGFGHDPHAWLNPEVAALWAMAISDVLGTADPENAALYQENAAQFATEVADLTAEIATMLEGIDGSTVLFPHDSTQYFEARFGLTPAGFIAEGDAADAGPAHLQELRARVTGGEITCVLSDLEINPGTVGILTEGTDVGTGMIDVTDSAGVGYTEMMRTMAKTIADCAS